MAKKSKPVQDAPEPQLRQELVDELARIGARDMARRAEITKELRNIDGLPVKGEEQL